MTTNLSTTLPADMSFDLRWTAWQARGAAQDRQLRRRASLVGLLLAGGFAAAFAAAFYLG